MFRQGREMQEARKPFIKGKPKRNRAKYSVSLILQLLPIYREGRGGWADTKNVVDSQITNNAGSQKRTELLTEFSLHHSSTDGCPGEAPKIKKNEKANFISSDVYSGVNFRRY